MNFMSRFSVRSSKSILSIFSLDLYKFPEIQAGFIPTAPDRNNCITFGKELAYPECGLFDMVHGRICDSGNVRSFVFSNCYQPLDIPRVEVMINHVSDIYGPDLLGKGEFDHEDRKQLIRGKWMGRVYSDPARYGFPVIVTYDENRLQLLITLDKKSVDSVIN